jgi:hypothetical protein
MTNVNPGHSGLYDPLGILRAARQAVPAVDYALGAAGVAAAGAIIVGLLGYGKQSAIIIGATFVAMILLFAFGRLVVAKSRLIVWAGIAVLWAVVVLFCSFMLFTVTAFVFGWPALYARYLGIQEHAELTQPLPNVMRPQPREWYFAKVVLGEPVGDCQAEWYGTAVTVFQKGWIVWRLTEDDHFAIVRTSDTQIEWFGDAEELTASRCEGLPDEETLRLRLYGGIHNWYCAARSAEMRSKLGMPEGKEMAIWAQFQTWNQGYLVVGLPWNTPAAAGGKFTYLSAIFLDNYPRWTRGTGRFSKVGWHNVKCDSKCSVNWYSDRLSDPRDTSRSDELGKQHCQAVRSRDDFRKQKGECRMC